MLEKMNQLESQIQSKLELAQTRRKQLEQEQLEKLRSHVSNDPPSLCTSHSATTQ
jgi:hypothetical protein